MTIGRPNAMDMNKVVLGNKPPQNPRAERGLNGKSFDLLKI
jgi:hypothetical protein